MGLFKFQCTQQDKVLKALIKTYGATPLRIPDNQTRPLDIIAYRGVKSKNRGSLEHILVNADAILPNFKKSEQANIQFSKTNELKAAFGLKILNGFLKGFNIGINPLEGNIHQQNMLSFEFKNVKKDYVHIGLLGRHLKDCRLDLENPSLSIFTRDEKPMDMYLINSVLKSNEFTVHVKKEVDNDGKIEIPVLQKITDAGAELSYQGEKSYSITFKNKRYLTFAFSCVEILFDKKTGQFSGIGEERNTRNMTDDVAESIVLEDLKAKPKSLIDEDVPALMSWDED
jgi:hypothetical protein